MRVVAHIVALNDFAVLQQGVSLCIARRCNIDTQDSIPKGINAGHMWNAVNVLLNKKKTVYLQDLHVWPEFL